MPRLVPISRFRRRRPDLHRPYETWAYPLPPLIFLLITGWTLFYTVMQRPAEAWLCLGVIASGAAFYKLSLNLGKQRYEL